MAHNTEIPHTLTADVASHIDLGPLNVLPPTRRLFF